MSTSTSVVMLLVVVMVLRLAAVQLVTRSLCLACKGTQQHNCGHCTAFVPAIWLRCCCMHPT